jgi:hypothetical protein
MVLSLANAVARFNKWKDDSAEVLVVSESPFDSVVRIWIFKSCHEHPAG